MKKSIFVLGAIIVVAILLYPQTTVSLSTGSPGGKTGSPMDNADCTSCHTVMSAPTSGLTSINSNIPPSGYVPGNTYTITATINPTSTLNGFEVTCEENTTNTKTGVLFITNPNETQLVNSGSSVTHTAGGNSMNIWSFNWEAPAAGTGGITFYGAFIEAAYPFGQNFNDYFSSTTLSVSEFIPPPQTYVPDDNFEQALINLGYDAIHDDSVLTTSIDTVTYLNIDNQNISDLTGIEDFTTLTALLCDNNQLTSLDVSNNIALTHLVCTNNDLIILNVSNNSTLTHLNCGGNDLTSLDVSNNTTLTSLSCGANQLSSLDLTNNSALTVFENTENFIMQSLDLRNGNNINLTTIYNLDAPNLTCISVDDAAWSTVNWTGIGPFGGSFCFDIQHFFNNNCSGGTTGIQEHTTNKELLKVTDLLGRETKQTNQPLFYIYDDGTVEKRIVIE